MAKQYRWATAHDWLREKYDIPEEVWCLLDQVDSDTIQDYFQSEMDEDGYFDALIGNCAECGFPADEKTGYKCHHCGRMFHTECMVPLKYLNTGCIYDADCADNVLEFRPEELETP